VVFYSGDNDLNAGKTPARVAADYKAFVSAIRPTAADPHRHYVDR
jgi:hypothetical protein